MLLSREIRFAIVDHYDDRITNSWSGWPATTMLAPHYSMKCVIDGTPDETGYICNIKDLDELMRAAVASEIKSGIEGLTIFQLFQKLVERCLQDWNSNAAIVQMNMAITPHLNLNIYSKDKNMVEFTQQFEFSAAHRLHCDHLSDDMNREIFGKCNNPEGHGHNYVIEISVKGPVGSTGQLIPIHDFESTVKQKVVDRLDHKHLNKDVDYFQNTNPTVENIAQAIFQWLDEAFDGVKLSRVRVYETPKTWAEYCGT